MLVILAVSLVKISVILLGGGVYVSIRWIAPNSVELQKDHCPRLGNASDYGGRCCSVSQF